MKRIDESIQKLADSFAGLNWNFEKAADNAAPLSHWLGDPKEDVMMCVFRGSEIHEQFHRQDFFFLNYAYEGTYRAVSSKYDHTELIHENDCYIAQPESGYAILSEKSSPCTIIGLLVKRGIFYRQFLPSLSDDPAMFQFFTNPEINAYSDEYIHFSFGKDEQLRNLLEFMCMEYAEKTDETSGILKPMAVSAFLIASRKKRQNDVPAETDPAAMMLSYIHTHPASVSLQSLSDHFSYHPSYISNLLHRKTGKTFSRILLETRMDAASSLLQTHSLKMEEIARLLGYADKSAFYKAFRSFYGKTPKQFLN